MNTHFDKYLNTRELIINKRPKLIVEIGIYTGENTRKIMSLYEDIKFNLVMIDDCLWMKEDLRNFFKKYPEDCHRFISGISYLKLRVFERESIDFCFIDSDHNYYTCKKELDALHPRLAPGGIVCLHDTESFGRKGGIMDCYGSGEEYPIEEIKKTLNKGIKDAIEDFIKDHQDYKVIGFSKESNGAIALQKR